MHIQPMTDLNLPLLQQQTSDLASPVSNREYGRNQFGLGFTSPRYNHQSPTQPIFRGIDNFNKSVIENVIDELKKENDQSDGIGANIS